MAANPWPYIVASFVITFAAIIVYAWSVLQRGRRLSRQVPAEKRRWMS